MNKNTYLAKRKNVRRAIMLGVVEQLEKKFPEGVPTMEIYNESFTKGYAYNYKTLREDLDDLEKKDIIIGKVVYLGKSWGTKKLWLINHEKDKLIGEKK